jgi:hypothetical protein
LERIHLDQIGYDPKYYPRVNGKEDWYTVNIYKDALLAKPSLAFAWTPDHPERGFPPVVLVRATAKKWPYLLLDGLHRLRTYHAAEYDEIPAVVERLPESKWFARSAELNVISKRGLDKGDKAWIAKRLEADGYTFKEAADLLHMRVESLERIVADCTVKLKASGAKNIPNGRGNREVDGKHFGFLKAPFAEFAGTTTAETALSSQGPVASMDALGILDSCVAVLECGVDMTDEEVVQRIERIRALLPTAVLS